MFNGIGYFEDQLVNCFGESGAEAFHDAVIFYLTNNIDFACETDKLILLSYIMGSRFTDMLNDEYNPLHYFSIKLFENK